MSNQAPTIPMFVMLRDENNNPVLVDIANINVAHTPPGKELQQVILFGGETHIYTHMSIEEIRDAIIKAQSRSLQMMTEIELQASIRATRAARQSVPR